MISENCLAKAIKEVFRIKPYSLISRIFYAQPGDNIANGAPRSEAGILIYYQIMLHPRRTP
jgi:hypothetical protein